MWSIVNTFDSIAVAFDFWTCLNIVKDRKPISDDMMKQVHSYNRVRELIGISSTKKMTPHANLLVAEMIIVTGMFSAMTGFMLFGLFGFVNVLNVLYSPSQLVHSAMHQDEVCCICLDHFDKVENIAGYNDNMQRVVVTKCGHCFHSDCLTKWCLQGQSNECPLCKSHMFALPTSN